MANIRKQFNFRNGVQVDDDNFIVSSTGLVGIGTTIPTESLDLYGNAKISGFATATELRAQTLVVSQTATIENITFNNSIIGSGVSIRSGVITATNSSGIVTYFGDARFLQGMPTSQWIDVDVGLGFTSIYAQGFVGVGTVDPRFVFQVAGNTDTTVAGFENGVGISSSGDILATGITTSGKFVGIGSDLTLLNASNISSGTIDSDRLPTISDSKLDPNLNLGIVTATTFVGTLSGTATTALGLSGTPNIIVGILTASAVAASSFIGGITGNVVGNLTGTATTATSLTPTADVDIADLTVGVATISTRLYVESIGVGTNSPSSDIHIRRNSAATLQVTSDTEEAIIAIGRSTTLEGNNGALIFGNTAGIYPYSNSRTLDIVNYDTGNINQYLDYGLAGEGAGNFNWFYAVDPTNPLMTLTYEGNLGLGVTNPTVKFQVSGIASVTSLVTENITATTNIVATGAGTSTSVQALYVYGGQSQILNSDGTSIFPPVGVTDNVNATSGVSTFFDINVTNNAIIDGNIGIGTTNPQDPIQVGSATTLGEYVAISEFGIGLGTAANANGFFLDGLTKEVAFGAVCIGSTDDVVDIPSNRLLYVEGNSRFNGNVGIGTSIATSKLHVIGNARITGILTIGTSSITLNGNTDTLTVPNLVVTNNTTGVAITVRDGGGNLGNASIIDFGDNLSVSLSAGIATITGSASGSSSQWTSTAAGIHTLSNVGIGTTNPTSALTVTGGGTFTGVVTATTFVGALTGTATTATLATNAQGLTGTPDITVGTIVVSGVTTSQNGFTSGIGVTDPVQITVSGNILTFNVVGVGSTSLILY
jgi:hypothetical protein